MILTFILMLALHLLTPYWWWVLLIPLLYGFFRSETPFRALFTGLISAGLLWGIFAAYHYMTDAAIVAQKIGAMMNITPPVFLVFVTALIGMICGGVACLSGHFLRSAFK